MKGKDKQMTTAQKVQKARELYSLEEDASTYLQSVCSMKELKSILATTNRKVTIDIVQDAIVIKKYNNSLYDKRTYVSL